MVYCPPASVVPVAVTAFPFTLTATFAPANGVTPSSLNTFPAMAALEASKTRSLLFMLSETNRRLLTGSHANATGPFNPFCVTAVAAVVKFDCPNTLVAFMPSLMEKTRKAVTRLFPFSATNSIFLLPSYTRPCGLLMPFCVVAAEADV